jgi:hypothetical protein
MARTARRAEAQSGEGRQQDRRHHHPEAQQPDEERGDLPIYGKQVVFIFDECHRSQFGEAQKNLKKKFKKFCQFGFTGTPIFPENAWALRPPPACLAVNCIRT